MVMGFHKAYRCKKCGAVFFKSDNGKLLLLSDENDIVSRPRPDKVTTPLATLGKLLGFLNCPKCGSLKVFEDIGIRT